MKREELEFLENKEHIEKVMSLYGKIENARKKELENLQTKLDKSDEELNAYKNKISEMEKTLKDNEDFKTKFEELQAENKEREEKAKAEAIEKEFNDRFETQLNGKKFTNDYTRQGLYSQFKEQLNLKENKGKGDKEIFDALTKNQNGLFESPNKIQDMPSMGESEQQKTSEMPLIW